jgi:hypothetical protein
MEHLAAGAPSLKTSAPDEAVTKAQFAEALGCQLPTLQIHEESLETARGYHAQESSLVIVKAKPPMRKVTRSNDRRTRTSLNNLVAAPKAESAFDYPEDFVFLGVTMHIDPPTGRDDPFEDADGAIGLLAGGVNNERVAGRMNEPLLARE